MGTPEIAEFWHLSNTSFHCTGRGGEVSLIKADGVIPHEVNELTRRHNVMAVELQRQKDGPLQVLPIFPHRDGLLEDYYFSLIHLIVLCGCKDECILPTFSLAALKTKKDGSSNGNVSRMFTNLFERMLTEFEMLADDLNDNLGSHSNRRGSQQAMTEDPNLSGYALTFRSGLRSKSIHVVFDYM